MLQLDVESLSYALVLNGSIYTRIEFAAAGSSLRSPLLQRLNLPGSQRRQAHFERSGAYNS
jgi:hypothetical protein